MSYQQEIERGAAWLDENEPGWERRIDVGKLRLQDCSVCVLGQTFLEQAQTDGYAFPANMDGFNWAVEVFELHGRVATLGFSVEYDDPRFKGLGMHDRDAAVDDAYVVLTDEWGAFIKDRFDRGALSDAEV
jgi:hypothetical protein